MPDVGCGITEAGVVVDDHSTKFWRLGVEKAYVVNYLILSIVSTFKCGQQSSLETRHWDRDVLIYMTCGENLQHAIALCWIQWVALWSTVVLTLQFNLSEDAYRNL